MIPVPAQLLAGLTYTVSRSDGTRVPLVSGGAQKPVTEANLAAYCDMAENFRRHEFDLQVPALFSCVRVCDMIMSVCVCVWGFF